MFFTSQRIRIVAHEAYGTNDMHFLDNDIRTHGTVVRNLPERLWWAIRILELDLRSEFDDLKALLEHIEWV